MRKRERERERDREIKNEEKDKKEKREYARIYPFLVVNKSNNEVTMSQLFLIREGVNNPGWKRVIDDGDVEGWVGVKAFFPQLYAGPK